MTREYAIECVQSFIDTFEICKENHEPIETSINGEDVIAFKMAIKALELIKYIEQRYEEECDERRKQYADGWYHSLSMCDGASYALGQVLDRWKENTEDKE